MNPNCLNRYTYPWGWLRDIVELLTKLILKAHITCPYKAFHEFLLEFFQNSRDLLFLIDFQIICFRFCWILIHFHKHITGNDNSDKVPNQNRAKWPQNNHKMSMKILQKSTKKKFLHTLISLWKSELSFSSFCCFLHKISSFFTLLDPQANGLLIFSFFAVYVVQNLTF